MSPLRVCTNILDSSRPLNGGLSPINIARRLFSLTASTVQARGLHLMPRLGISAVMFLQMPVWQGTPKHRFAHVLYGTASSVWQSACALHALCITRSPCASNNVPLRGSTAVPPCCMAQLQLLPVFAAVDHKLPEIRARRGNEHVRRAQLAQWPAASHKRLRQPAIMLRRHGRLAGEIVNLISFLPVFFALIGPHDFHQ